MPILEEREGERGGEMEREREGERGREGKRERGGERDGERDGERGRKGETHLLVHLYFHLTHTCWITKLVEANRYEFC